MHVLFKSKNINILLTYDISLPSVYDVQFLFQVNTKAIKAPHPLIISCNIKLTVIAPLTDMSLRAGLCAALDALEPCRHGSLPILLLLPGRVDHLVVTVLQLSITDSCHLAAVGVQHVPDVAERGDGIKCK